MKRAPGAKPPESRGATAQSDAPAEDARAIQERLRTEIAGRQEIEAAFRASQERFQALVDAIPQLAWTANADGFIHWYNRRWYEYTGATPQHMEGWGWQSVHDPKKLPEVLARWSVSIATGESFDMIFPLRGADGVFRSFLTRVLPLKDAAGTVTQWFGTNTDVDELQRAQEALARQTEELARADRSKDEFLAMLAHELRNPLAPIRNAAEILREGDPTQREEAAAILALQVESMGRMIDDLLDVSRINEGKIGLRKSIVSMEAILDAAAHLNRAALDGRGQTLEIALPRKAIFLEADATRLAQVFGNLLSNACKYGSAGGRIVVTAAFEDRESEAAPEAVVRVRDDGMGMAPELLPRIFDLFTQGDRALDRAQGGLGIGLTVAQRLVKLHGGSIEAHSDGPGCGSEFVVRLPATRRGPVSHSQPRPPAPPEAPRRMLIVDDNEASAVTMAALQSRRGHITRTAFTGEQALALAGEFKPDVLLLDIGLPGLDGYEVARRMRADTAHAGIFIIAMTGYGSDDDRAKARAAGFDKHLVKPVDLDLLREWLLGWEPSAGNA